MKTGLTIEFNNGIFNVVYFDGNEIRLQRTTKPKIIQAGDFKDGKIKLMGWNRFHPYKIIKNTSKNTN